MIVIQGATQRGLKQPETEMNFFFEIKPANELLHYL
jgi:hypothetical protein